MNEQREAEALFAVWVTEGDDASVAAGAAQGAKVNNVRFIREMEPSETEASKAAADLLGRLTLGSGLADLRSAANFLHEEIARLRQGPVEPPLETSGARLRREFKAWLSAFRAFDDRTSAWLARTFGQNDAAYVEFKRLLSEQFDANFAYRLSCALRNIAEHESDVVSAHIRVRHDRESGTSVKQVDVQLDGPRIARDHGRKMRSATREELLQVTGPLEVERIVGAVDVSCERVHCGLFVTLWDRLDAAAAVCEGHHTEATSAGGDWAFYVPTKSLQEAALRPAQFDMRRNAYHLSQKVRGLRKVVEDTLEVELVDGSWHHFVKDR
jgi:hypothetical protein